MLHPEPLTGQVVSARFPMPMVPEGWYAVARSSAVRAGKIVSLNYFSKALIAYRGRDGVATVRDAHCPHYGAHLGVGGKMVDGTVECPFHGWRFDAQGKCTVAPFAPRAPKVTLRGYPTAEHSGLIFAYIGGQGAPQWNVPAIPEATAREYASPIVDVSTARIHIQEMRENIVDESHFHYIHRQAEPPQIVLETNGPVAYVKSRIARTVAGIHVDNSFDADMYGPGVMVVRTQGRFFSMTALALTTPIDAERSEMTMLYYVRKPRGAALALTPLLKLIFRISAFKEVHHEVAIWDNKIHRAKPILLPHEQGIRALRQWYQQFYPPADQLDGA
ncbi:3-ketosteroid-9-alpha-monooxygenase oxygenase subunit [Mycobacteroides salmoniphilum]|uniref:Rieske-type oxygenase n=2 Tax=Mycobacteroides salmoniphilum TaxID=404941 RepID=A0A4R8S016_9MYCO|nr:3-ketosteroid-9-alpha-monooxygenase oxygenase subunit [Mycobacteroides salmoniphilum]TDZ80151.1 3-ketosteroid-9-alpha-monooxygenase oxygenase subunit [Mycobacteroides salmoniphilum]TDZ86515.1 3-ketosteroid-9-alpha-monooxygenase oxygenase subunit [Mycobacteroides salmoniphilum]